MTRAGWRSNAPLRKPMIGSQPPGRPCLILADNNRARALAVWPAVLYLRPGHQYLPVPPWGAHTAFVFLRGQPPGNRNKWWRQFWRRVFDYQPVLMRRPDGRQRCHRTCEVLSSNVSARRSAFICGCSTKAMHACRVPEITELRRPASLGKRAQALRPRRDETQSRHCERL